MSAGTVEQTPSVSSRKRGAGDDMEDNSGRTSNGRLLKTTDCHLGNTSTRASIIRDVSSECSFGPSSSKETSWPNLVRTKLSRARGSRSVTALSTLR